MQGNRVIKLVLGSFIHRTADRAAVNLWVKPFQNMRSTRATELIRTEPAHVVNAIMGHTEAVAMAHYRQVTDSDFERLSGQNRVPQPSSANIQDYSAASAENGFWCFADIDDDAEDELQVLHRNTPERGCKALLGGKAKTPKSLVFQEFAPVCEVVQNGVL